MPLIKPNQSIIPFPSLLKDDSYDEKEVLEEIIKLQVNSTESGTNLKRFLMEKSRIEDEIKVTMNVHILSILDDALPPKENDPWSLEKLAPTKLIIELADRTIKRPKGLVENVLVGIDKFVFPVDFIVLDMPDDVKVPLIPERPLLSTAHAKIDVFKRKIALRVGNDKIVFKCDSPTSNLIKRVYVLGLRERMEVDLEARLMAEALILDRSQDPGFGDFLELNDLNVPLELRNNAMEDLESDDEDGEIVDEP
ncbi:two-component response regulator-like APRR2 isoform X1 [Tanacetum coccineum]